MMGQAEYETFRDDIAEHGLRTPVELYEGRILEGRNRAKACKELGIEVEYIELDDHDIGGDPVAYVVSANLKRRHLSESQRAMVAVELEAYHAKAAKERMRAGKKQDPVAPVQQGRAVQQAASQMQVGSRSVSSAKKVTNEGAKQVADAVRSGAVSVKVAETLVKTVGDKKQQAEIIKQAVKSDAPDKAIKQAIAPKNPPPDYTATDRVMNAIEHFAATVQWIEDHFGGVAKMVKHETWDSRETSAFRQHVNALPKLVGDLKTELQNVK